MTTFTREQIDTIEIGNTKIAHGINGRFSEATTVVDIFAKCEDIHGKLFVCGYRQYGEGARISFSIKEGDEIDALYYRISNHGETTP